MPEQQIRVIPIRRELAVSESDQLVAHVAFCLWLSSGFRGASPEAALFTALRLVKGKSWSGLFLVPKAGQASHPGPPMKNGPSGISQ